MGQLRVTYLISGLGPGGAETALLRLVKRLDRARFAPKVIVLMERPGSLEHTLARVDVPVVRLRARRHRLDLRVAVRLFRILRRTEPHILHTHLLSADLLGRFIGRLSRVPAIVSTVHNVELEGRYKEILYRTTVPMCDACIAVSEQVARAMLEKEIVPRSKLEMIPNGVDSEAFAPCARTRRRLRRRLRLAAGTFLWIAVGALEPRKDYRTLLNAFSSVSRVRSDACLLVVGDGSLRARCEALVARLGLQRSVRRVCAPTSPRCSVRPKPL